MSPKIVEIDVNPVTRPRVPMIVAFPGEEVSFKSNNGHSTFFFPKDNQIFEESGPVVFDVSAGKEKTLRINKLILKNSDNNKSIDRRGALFVEYAVYCTQERGDAYFAEGNSAPRIIIPRGPGG
jgi:hypothetical protein